MDAVVILQSPSTDTGDRLRSVRDDLLNVWIGRVRSRVAAAADQDTLTLLNALPRFLDALADALETHAVETVKAAICREHGEQRANLKNYTLEQVVVEYELLEQILLEVIDREGALSKTEVETVRGFVFSGIKEAVVAFSEKQTAALLQEKALLRALLESMGEGVIAVDPRGEVLFSNPATAAVRGMPFDNSGPVTWPAHYGLFLPDMTTPFPVEELPIMKALRGESCDDVEIFVRNSHVPDGLWQCVSSRPIVEPPHKITGAVTVIANITRRKKMEQELKLTLEELSRSNKELEQFVAVASHDLTEPTSLINALLNYSKVTHNRQPFRAIHTSQLVSQILANLHLMIQETNAEISVVSGMPEVRGDRGLLGQLFQNLIFNALRFHSTERPRVEIRADDRGADWIFSVSDNGVGIPEANLAGLFDPFVPPRYGIGLAIAKRAVDVHHGQIWVKSTPGRGSTFYFTLPKAT